MLAELQAQALKPMDGDTTKKINEAIKHLTKSVNSTAWLDDSHLATKDFDPVFNEEQAAIDQTRGHQGHSGIDRDHPGVDAVAGQRRQAAGDDRVRGLVHLPSTSTGDLKKYNDELAKGDVEFSKGAGHYDAAIGHYKNAWKAIKP